MKNKARELDVDFIGGQNNPLTKEEEKDIFSMLPNDSSFFEFLDDTVFYHF